MKNISKLLWVGLLINLLLATVVYFSAIYLHTQGMKIDYDAWVLSNKLNHVKFVLPAIVIIQFVNVFVIMKFNKISTITSFLSAFLSFPMGAIYFIGCLFSIQYIRLSNFDKANNELSDANSIAKFPTQKYLNRSLVWFVVTIVSYFLFQIFSAISFFLMMINAVSFFRSEKYSILAEINDGFIITPTIFSCPIFVSSSEICAVVKQDDGVNIETVKGNIKIKTSVIDKNEFDRAAAQLSLAALNNY